MLKNSIGIESIASYLPPDTISSDALAKSFDTTTDFIENKLGITNLHVALDEGTTDLAVNAVNNLLLKNQSALRDLDVLIVCTQTPDVQLPHISAVIQGRFNLPKTIACFDIALGCSGFVYGSNIIESLMKINGWSKGILITSEKYSSIIDPQDKNTKSLFSDAATASLFSRNWVLKSKKYIFGTNGQLSDSLIVRAHDSGSGKRLFMDGRAIYNFAISEIPDLVIRTCRINEIKLEEIDYFVFHQASRFILNALSKKLNIKDEQKLVDIMGVAGNTVSSSIPMALEGIIDSNPKECIRVLVCGFGVGLSWGAGIFSSKIIED